MPNVKTAISVPEELFKSTQELAEELNLSRSGLIALAIREFIERHKNRKTLEQLNQVYSTPSEEEELLALRRAAGNLKDVEW